MSQGITLNPLCLMHFKLTNPHENASLMLQQKLTNAQVIEKKPCDDTETLKVTVFILCVCMLTCFYSALTEDFSKMNHAINSNICFHI